MRIIQNYKGRSGVDYLLEYTDADSFDQLEYARCRQSYGVCFCGDKIVVGFGGNKKDWGLIGGTVEEGETVEQALIREVKEESNMEVLKYMPIGYQKVTDTRTGSYIFQLRYAAIVRPYGLFVADPDHGITAIKLINPKDYKQYFNWGEIGERIITRARELKGKMGF